MSVFDFRTSFHFLCSNLFVFILYTFCVCVFFTFFLRNFFLHSSQEIFCLLLSKRIFFSVIFVILWIWFEWRRSSRKKSRNIFVCVLFRSLLNNFNICLNWMKKKKNKLKNRQSVATMARWLDMCVYFIIIDIISIFSKPVTILFIIISPLFTSHTHICSKLKIHSNWIKSQSLYTLN